MVGPYTFGVLQPHQKTDKRQILHLKIDMMSATTEMCPDSVRAHIHLAGPEQGFLSHVFFTIPPNDSTQALSPKCILIFQSEHP